MVADFRSGAKRNNSRKRSLRGSPALAGLHDGPGASNTEAGDENDRLRRWPKKCAKSCGVLAGVITVILGIAQLVDIFSPASDNTTFETDGHVWLTRSPDNRQIELLLNVSLLNEGKKTAAIPTPKVSLFAGSVENMLDIPEENLRFGSSDPGAVDKRGDVHFPIYVGPGTKSLEKITCSIGCGPNCLDWDQWHRQGVWHLNLVFSHNGRLENRCFVFWFPVPESIENLSPNIAKPIPLVDCSDYGDSPTGRNS